MYELNYNIGLCYYMEKKYAPALISFDAAIKKLPFDAKSFQYRGMTKFYMGDKKAAKADLELARKYYGSSSSVETQRQIQVIDQYLKWLSKY